MKKLILAGAAALALAIPAAAQDVAVTARGDVAVLTTDQQTMYDGWPADRQTSYMSWPSNDRSYYWTLTPSQQTGWWALTNEQRVRVQAMTPEERMTTWASIERQMMSAPSANASATATTATTGAMTASTMGPRSVSNAVTQMTPASTRAGGEYPLCSATVTDSCINPREAGKNYGNRPLKYWPGRPASEMPGKKPQM